MNIDILFCLAALLGCLLPDCDHKNAICGYVLPVWILVKHGTVTHTLLFSFCFLAMFTVAKNTAWLGLWFGITNHLLADNWQGNNLKYLYYPFKRRKK